jgi:hypothetical protein
MFCLHTVASLCRNILVLVLLFITQVFADAWHALCYYPSGDVSPDDTPCSAAGGACCPKDWDCLSNGMCYSEEKHHERHSCTDQNWSDARCPYICLAGESFLLTSYWLSSNLEQAALFTKMRTSGSVFGTTPVLGAATEVPKGNSRTAVQKQRHFFLDRAGYCRSPHLSGAILRR